MLRYMAGMTGWLGHSDIPHPARVRREYPRSHIDGLDCLLAIWIAEAMLEAPSDRSRKEPARLLANHDSNAR